MKKILKFVFWDDESFSIRYFMMLSFSVVGFIAIVILLLIGFCELNSKTYNYPTFQEIRSMDWDSDEERYMLKVATYKGGTVGDRAYNILVILNRVWDDGYPSNIREVCELELPEGLPPEYTEEEWNKSEEALLLIKCENFDNSDGSLEYRE